MVELLVMSDLAYRQTQTSVESFPRRRGSHRNKEKRGEELLAMSDLAYTVQTDTKQTWWNCLMWAMSPVLENVLPQ